MMARRVLVAATTLLTLGVLCGWRVSGCLGWRAKRDAKAGGSDHHQRQCHRRTWLQLSGATVEGNVTVEPGGSLTTEEETERRSRGMCRATTRPKYSS